MTFLDGFIPYSREQIAEYTANGAWENLTYCDLLKRAAARRPNHVAVVDENHRLTYQQLKVKVDRFALALLELGIKPHDRLIIQMPNRHEFIVALYGLQRIGAVPVLAIPRHGRQEISTFFTVTRAAGWIVPAREGKNEFIKLIDEIRSQCQSLRYIIMPGGDEGLLSGTYSMEKIIDAAAIEDSSADRLDQLRPDPNDVAVLIPTGGTTGLPKIVPRTFNSLMVTNKCISRMIDQSDRLLQATPVGHAMAMQGSVNCAIYKGATLILQRVPKPAEIMKTIQKEKVTRVNLVPTQLEGILNHPELNRFDLSSLKKLGTTGAALPLETAKKASEYFARRGCMFSGSGLGASEGLLAGGSPNESLEEQLKTIGRNITPGSHYKVIDENERDLPPNQDGELVARGPEVFTGYYNTSEKENREVFTADGYYKTGDIARINERGYITITGRKKDVILRGGETLVPGKMEELIREHPHVESAAVVGMPDPVMGERACAYVVPKVGKSLHFQEMVDFLKSQGAGVLLLPERLEIIDKLPETGVGKIDKKALRRDIIHKLDQRRKANGTSQR